MGLNNFTIDTLTSAEDMISFELTELGATGVEVEDHVSLTEEEMKVMYVDLLPDDIAPDDGKAKISCYFDENENLEHITMQIQAMLERLRGFMDIGAGTISFDKTKEEDWVNNWKKFFSSFYIDDILIKPSWEELKPEDADKFLIEIDPGVSFGSGKHDTTQLCIRQLLKYIRGNETYTPQVKTPKVLDVGCGSGILSIVALKLGASEVVGTDLDPDCMTSTHDNMEVNHLDQKLGTFYVGNLIDDTELQEKVGTEEFDIVVANILADVIIPFAPVFPARL